jgi:hypothetical protein
VTKFPRGERLPPTLSYVRRLLALSSSCRSCATGGNLSKQVICLKPNLCYPAQVVGNQAALDRGPFFGEGQCGKIFFIWIRSNPLKSLDSAKRIQAILFGFPWIYLARQDESFCLSPTLRRGVGLGRSV